MEKVSYTETQRGRAEVCEHLRTLLVRGAEVCERASTLLVCGAEACEQARALLVHGAQQKLRTLP